MSAEESNPRLFKDELAQVRHDLRTSAGHITGYAEMLSEELEDTPYPEFSQDLQRIHTSGQRLLELIDEHLGASKTSPEELDVAFTQHQLRLQLNHILGYGDLLRELAQEDGHDELLADLERIISGANSLLKLVEERVVPLMSIDDRVSEPDEVDQVEKSVTPTSNTDPAQDSIGISSLGEGGDILIVDDDAANRDLLERRLKRQGYRTQTVDSGQAALEQIDRDRPDVVLLDMVMPGISGIEVLKQLKNDRALRNIPVIMLSALDDMERIVECVMLGAEDYLLKPTNPVLLRARINATLEKHRLRKQQAKKLRVFISSPGDVEPERRIAKQVIAQLNEEFSGKLHLVPVLWEEEPLLATDTAQPQIFPAKDTEIYIGIFWARMGTMLPENIVRADGSRYLSGSEFEYEDAIAAFRANGKPEMLVYRKTADPMVSLKYKDVVLEWLRQKEMLEDFFMKWFESDDGQSYIGSCRMFETESEFEELLLGHLRKLVSSYLS